MAKRQHRRVVRVGTEKFDADGVKLDPEDAQTEQARLRDDDQRILTELPPHWAKFDAEKE
ncbi:MAG: hypothetical protein LKI93_02080 [Bifidobacteriaceae bacterium]|jgi:hypothetical protein|nr:hypothetical protein [Bifidobacteriaceae bacterium]MCI1914963.1 hypothetical protein [Bifidobacteriaceae bacterium]